MDHETFVHQLKDPKTFGLPEGTELDIVQTHISFVVLTGDFAYKIKKPVDFGFLDFSTLEKRKHFCEEELRLNTRLCPELYECVIRFTETDNGHVQIDGDGPVVEYAVKMEQFPQENMMTELLEKNMISTSQITDLVDQLVSFYNSSPVTDEIASYGSVNAVKKNIDENFEQTKDKISLTISADQYQKIKKINELFFTKKAYGLQKRKNEGCIKSCHGDLHSGNIVLFNDSLCIFDCIEFNKRFRFIDVASDIGFLAMDLDIRNKPFLSSYFIHQYLKKSSDDSLLSVLNFYKSYRAYVRGKVLGFQLDDLHIDHMKKKVLIDKIGLFFDLSEYYASLMEIHIRCERPLVFMMSGLTGTGKSTVADKIAIDYNAIVINTDVVRKEKAGVGKYERHFEDPNKGMYSPKRVHQTYEQVIDYAKETLMEGRNVILDATFQKKEHRDMARSLAQKFNAIFIPIYCTCPEPIAKKWLEGRMKSKSVSDGRWEIYQIQKKSFETFTDEEEPIIFNTAECEYEKRMNNFSFIRKRIYRDEL